MSSGSRPPACPREIIARLGMSVEQIEALQAVLSEVITRAREQDDREPGAQQSADRRRLLEGRQVGAVLEDHEPGAGDEAGDLLVPLHRAEPVLAGGDDEGRAADLGEPGTFVDPGRLQPELGVVRRLAGLVGHGQGQRDQVLPVG